MDFKLLLFTESSSAESTVMLLALGFNDFFQIFRLTEGKNGLLFLQKEKTVYF